MFRRQAASASSTFRWWRVGAQVHGMDGPDRESGMGEGPGQAEVHAVARGADRRRPGRRDGREIRVPPHEEE